LAPDRSIAIEQLIQSLSGLDRLSFVSRRPVQAGLGGEHRASRQSPSTDFVDYRPYHPGDDFRRVDWNVYARLGSLQVKLTEGRERLDVTLVLDCSSSMAYGEPDKLSFAAQLVAALAYVGMARSDSVRISCLGAPDRPLASGVLRRRSRFPKLVEELSRIAPVGLVDLSAGLSTCLPEDAHHSLVVLVSDLLTRDGVAASLEALQSRRLDVVVLHLVSPQEMDPRFSGEVELIDAETDQTLELGISLETLRAYRARFAAWLARCQGDCLSRGIRYVRVPTNRPLSSIMLDDLRRARVLR
jgi:uncharacterized protein (DUF58 family)